MNQHRGTPWAAAATAAALIVVLAACGGGDGGSTTPTTTMPSMPSTPEVSGPSFERSNPTGEDLLDHWNSPTVAQATLGVTTANVPMGNIAALLRGTDQRRETSRALFRNAAPSTIETIGESGGITYGQWKDGPAGTLNIEFDWSRGQSATANQRGDLERAAKAWSYRLRDDFPARQVRTGHNYRGSGIIFTEPMTADDILIAVEVKERYDGTVAGGSYLTFTESNNELEPWFGHLEIQPEFLAGGPDQSSRFRVRAFTHEIGHTLGMHPLYRSDRDWSLNPEIYKRLIDRENATFTGANAMAANGGNPVPYQWVGADSTLVPPGTPGAEVDYGHLGPCRSIMAYCANSPALPSELDFAILDDIGYDLLPASEAAEPEVYGYGAWATYSAWGAGVERIIQYDESGDAIRVTDQLSAHVDAFGTMPGTAFADAHDGMTGSASWNGSLLGVDIGRAMLPPVFGDAAMTVDLATLEADVAFSGLTSVVDGRSEAFRTSSLAYDLDINGNTFADSDGVINGAFYGPGHEEMAGVLDDQSSSVNLIAGFGGTR